MKCLILAAGYATRLYPLTENFPKPLLKVKEKAILDWLVDDLADIVEEFIVISNHRYYPHFLNWAKEKKLPIQVLDDGTETNATRLGAVKDILFAAQTLALQEDLLVIAGDNVLDFSLKKFAAYAQEKQAACLMRYYHPDKEALKKFGVLCVDETDRVTYMVEKPQVPPSHWSATPFYYYPAADVLRIPEAIADGCGTDAPGSFIAWLSSRQPVYAMEMPGKRYDIGDMTTYTAAQKEYPGIRED